MAEFGFLKYGASSGKLHPLAYLLSPRKDLLMGLVWFISIANDTVVWRGKRYLNVPVPPFSIFLLTNANSIL